MRAWPVRYDELDRLRPDDLDARGDSAIAAHLRLPNPGAPPDTVWTLRFFGLPGRSQRERASRFFSRRSFRSSSGIFFLTSVSFPNGSTNRETHQRPDGACAKSRASPPNRGIHPIARTRPN